MSMMILQFSQTDRWVDRFVKCTWFSKMSFSYYHLLFESFIQVFCLNYLKHLLAIILNNFAIRLNIVPFDIQINKYDINFSISFINNEVKYKKIDSNFILIKLQNHQIFNDLYVKLISEVLFFICSFRK
jgi:hypothetical protein